MPLRQVADIRSGGTPSRRKPEYWNGSIPWVGTGAINSEYITEATEFITELGLKNSSTSIFQPGTILLAMIGQGATRGKVARLAIHAATNQNCAGIRAHAQVDSTYLFHYLANNYKWIRSLGNAGGVSNLNVTLVGSIPIVVPPLHHQKTIARMVDDWSRAVRLLEAAISAKRRLKRGLMSHLLRPNGERLARLETLFARVTRRVISKDIDTLSITAGVGFVTQSEKFNKIIAGATFDRYTLIENGDFAYNKGNSKHYPYGCVYRLAGRERAAVPQVYFCFKQKSDDVDPEYFAYLFESGALNAQLARLINRGVRNDGLMNIDASDFLKMEVAVPSRSYQASVAAALQLIDRELLLLTREANLLRDQRGAVMRKLLSSETV